VNCRKKKNTLNRIQAIIGRTMYTILEVNVKCSGYIIRVQATKTFPCTSWS